MVFSFAEDYPGTHGKEKYRSAALAVLKSWMADGFAASPDPKAARPEDVEAMPSLVLSARQYGRGPWPPGQWVFRNAVSAWLNSSAWDKLQ
ncbi:MAG: hypothetical protein ACN6O3_13975, partial [Comamonas sp.]